MFPVAFWTKTKHEGDNPIQLSVTIPKYCFWVEMTEEERKRRTENTEGGEKKGKLVAKRFCQGALKLCSMPEHNY